MARTIAKDHDQKRGQILKSAAAVFAREGFDRASMNQVSAACKISKAALYHYFPSKNAILFAILERHLKALCTRVATLDHEGRGPEEFLVYMTEQILLAYDGYDDIHELQMHAMGQLDKAEQKTLRSYMHTIVGHVAEAIKAVAPDRFQDEDSLRMATMTLFGMLNWYYTWNQGKGIDRRRQYARYAAHVLLGGVYRG